MINYFKADNAILFWNLMLKDIEHQFLESQWPNTKRNLIHNTKKWKYVEYSGDDSKGEIFMTILSHNEHNKIFIFPLCMPTQFKSFINKRPDSILKIEIVNFHELIGWTLETSMFNGDTEEFLNF